VVKVIAELALASGLVGAATMAGDRFGQRVAGLVSGLPVVVGPLLLIAAQQRGLRFAAATANGVLLGLPALGAFAFAYARSAQRGPAVGLLSGWAAAAVTAALIWLCPLALPFPGGLLVAMVSLTVAFRSMPQSRRKAVGPSPSRSSLGSVVVRMGTTAGLVLLLWTALAVFGPVIGGMLAALPTVVSVLVLFAHRDCGPEAAVSLLRGGLAGMASFVGFCAVVALMLVGAGVATTFAVGCLLATSLGALVTCSRRFRPSRAR
jgi:hypothetical protein